MWVLDSTDFTAVKAFLEARTKDGKAFEILLADGSQITVMLAGNSVVIPWTQEGPGTYTVGPLDLMERL